MAQYKCENCNELRDSLICPKCGADTHLLDEPVRGAVAPRPKPVPAKPAPAEPVPAPPPEPLREPIRTTQAPPRPRPVADPPPKVQYDGGESAPPPRPAAAPVAPDVVGLDEFHAVLDRGTKAVIICGDAKSGKSEIAGGYIRANTNYRGRAQNLTLRAVLRTDYALGATNPNEVWYQIIDHKRAFLDPSGEFFNMLSPDTRQRLGLGDVSEADFHFVQRAVSKLAGIVLVVDLTHAVETKQQSPWQRQEDNLKFVLSALRWLRWDKEARPEAIRLSTNIAQQVSKFPRIDKRVLVLFSKADQLKKLTNQNPVDFARKRLPTLHGALMTHARRFRYDFCNTMIKTARGDEATDPCGLLLPMDWLLDDPLRWLPLQLPTSWIGGGR